MSAVSSFYSSVVNEVIDNLKTQFNEDGIDPAALNDLKELWEKKIKESGALDPPKQNHVPASNQFTSMMQQNASQGNLSGRITCINNAGSRLIKPSGQGAMINDQGYTTTRMTLPVFQVQQGHNYRGNAMVPMVINAGGNQQQGVTLFGQYHNIIAQQQHQQGATANIISDNGVNLRKNNPNVNQTDGVDDSDDDDEEEEGGDFVNVSEVDPLSVRAPMSNAPGMTPIFKREKKRDDSDNDLEDHEIDVLNSSSSVHRLKEEESDDDDGNDDEDEIEDAANEEAPLNSGDDISDDEPERIFDSENVIVCQYDKVSRTRNKWKLNFVSGIANLYGKDTVFHKAVGEAEW